MAKRVISTKKPETSIIQDEHDFGKHIKYKRTSIGMSKQELADFCNLNYQTVDNIENGKKGTRLSSSLYVATMLGMEINVLTD
ncbi:MAG: helix-turn-helix domain-containing protein [Campylobacterota bacterium]|nr:helix-turn-helix domain-containing protein [Campylobacterota bacterium]